MRLGISQCINLSLDVGQAETSRQASHAFCILGGFGPQTMIQMRHQRPVTGAP